MRMVTLKGIGNLVYINPEAVQSVVETRRLEAGVVVEDRCVVVLKDCEYVIDYPAWQVVALLTSASNTPA